MICVSHFPIENLNSSKNDKLSISQSEVSEGHVSIMEWGVDPSRDPRREESVGMRGVGISKEAEHDADVQEVVSVFVVRVSQGSSFESGLQFEVASHHEDDVAHDLVDEVCRAPF